jgi:alkanesulfonate monooxygenase SsuD/methylene tetrahydromethanopterin reductase-like flavin-dependent oxidoreductase (luciferase family)
MKLAITFAPVKDDWQAAVDYAVEAERLGIDMAWTAETWGYDGATPWRTWRLKHHACAWEPASCRSGRAHPLWSP